MTPQLLDEDFVLRGLKGTGKSPGSDVASTQSGPERSSYERREDIKSESFHMCVNVLQQDFLDYNSPELSLELVPSLGGPVTSPFPCLHAVLCLMSQSCLTLCDSMDCSPPGSSVPGDSPGKTTGVPSCTPYPPEYWRILLYHPP